MAKESKERKNNERKKRRRSYSVRDYSRSPAVSREGT
jgi:hypothetical protein